MESITQRKETKSKDPAENTGTPKIVVAEVIIYPRKAAASLFVVAGVLVAINLLGIYLEKIVELDTPFTHAIVFFFDVGKESNVPTLFSTLILALAALQLYLIYRLARSCRGLGNFRQWLILACIFLFLTIDEATSVHEQFNKLRTFTSDSSGYLYYAWILPYALFALLTGLYFLNFLRALPRRTRQLFIVSGVVFVLAALGFEPLQGRVLKVYEIGHLYDRLLSSVEELLEMLAIILFNYALMDYLAAAKAKVGFPSPPLSPIR